MRNAVVIMKFLHNMKDISVQEARMYYTALGIFQELTGFTEEEVIAKFNELENWNPQPRVSPQFKV